MTAIEHNFPSGPLSVLAELESWRKEVNRPTYHMHKWWATRLGSVFRAILIGALSENDTDIWNAFYSSVSFQGKVILDPFMGAGSPINYDAILVCKRLFTPISVSLEAALKDVLERTREKLRVLSQDTHLSNLSNGDRFVIIQSQALCVFSQHNGYVIDDLGESVTLSRFLLATARSLNTISAHDDKQVEEMAERAAF